MDFKTILNGISQLPQTSAPMGDYPAPPSLPLSACTASSKHPFCLLTAPERPQNPPPDIRVYQEIQPLRQWRRQELLSGRTVGFVPTMGALHDGHLSLIRQAALDHPTVVVSIFVNPAQFGPTEDLDKYPRTLDPDLANLRQLNVELAAMSHPGGPHKRVGVIRAIFNPAVPVLYPSGIPLEQSAQRGTFVHVTPISSILEGVARPHFFRGVATVVTKLFNIVQPESVYFGQKDIQQTCVIRKLVRDLCFDIDIVVCPTAREDDGLAMSSRNVYLGEVRRRYAQCLYLALKAAEEVLYREGGKTRRRMHDAAAAVLEPYVQDGRIQVEYISIADCEEMNEYRDEKVVVGDCVISGAIRMAPREEAQGVVRLIDNILIQ